MKPRPTELTLNIPAPKPKPEPINNTDLVTAARAEGIYIYHARPLMKGERGISFAYRAKRNRIEFSTAVQHGADDFTKKVGTKLALERFNEGKTVFLPRFSANVRPTHILQNLLYIV